MITRRLTLLGLAFAALVSAAAFVHAAEIILIVDARRIPVIQLPAASATHELKLTAYTFRGARWVLDDIASAVDKSARLLAQCAVALTEIDLRTIEAPRRFHDYSTPVSRELLRTVKPEKPALFFVEDTKNDPAFDAEAIGLANARNRPELANTVWVAYGARDLPHALAHELVHVLSDSGDHSDEPGNLMRADTAPGNHALTPAQCERLRSRGEANGLLQRKTMERRS